MPTVLTNTAGVVVVARDACSVVLYGAKAARVCITGAHIGARGVYIGNRTANVTKIALAEDAVILAVFGARGSRATSRSRGVRSTGHLCNTCTMLVSEHVHTTTDHGIQITRPAP